MDPTIWQELQHFFNAEIELKNGILQSILLIDEETGRPNFAGMFACYAFPVLTVMIFWLMMGSYF